jgi:hypothetical protein
MANSRTIANWVIEWSWVIPFIAAVWFFAHFSVDVPFQDQWELPYLFTDVATRHSPVPELLSCHNDHPIVFPKLIWIALAFTTKWNTRVDMAITLLVAAAMFAPIALIGNEDDRPGTNWMTGVSLFAASLLVFSFVHYDDWLFGFQLHWILANTCTVWAVYLVWKSTGYPLLKQLLAWACCLVASFSVLYGMVSWLVIIPTQFTAITDRRRRTAAVAASVILLGTCIAVYLGLMTRLPNPRIDHSFWHKHPLAALEYFCALMGAPLAQGVWIAPAKPALVLGLAVVGIFTFCAALLLHQKRLESCVPWISIGLFALGFCAMATVGRSFRSVTNAAHASHYMSVSVLLAVAALQLSRQAMRGRQGAFVALAGAVGALSIAGSVASLPKAHALKEARSKAAAYLEIERYVDPATDAYPQSCLFPLFPVKSDTHWIRPGAELLDDLGFRKIAMHVPFIENPSMRYGTFQVLTEGRQTPAVHDGDTVAARGWVVIHAAEEAPQFVVISVGDARVFITAAWVGHRSKRRFLRLGTGEVVTLWSTQIPAVFLPRGQSVLRAWLYRKHAQEFVRLADVNGPQRVYKAP